MKNVKVQAGQNQQIRKQEKLSLSAKCYRKRVLCISRFSMLMRLTCFIVTLAKESIQHDGVSAKCY